MESKKNNTNKYERLKKRGVFPTEKICYFPAEKSLIIEFEAGVDPGRYKNSFRISESVYKDFHKMYPVKEMKTEVKENILRIYADFLLSATSLFLFKLYPRQMWKEVLIL